MRRIPIAVGLAVAFNTSATHAHDAAPEHCVVHMVAFNQELKLLTERFQGQMTFAYTQSAEWNAAAQSGDQTRMWNIAVNHMNNDLPQFLNLVKAQTDISMKAFRHALDAIECLAGHQ